MVACAIARSLGISEAECDAAIDGDDTKHAFVKLILSSKRDGTQAVSHRVAFNENNFHRPELFSPSVLSSNKCGCAIFPFGSGKSDSLAF